MKKTIITDVEKSKSNFLKLVIFRLLSKKSLFMLVLVLLFIVLVPYVITLTGSASMVMDTQELIQDNASLGYSLDLHLFSNLDGIPQDSLDSINNSLDGIDFSQVYELTVIKGNINDYTDNDYNANIASYKYFGPILFPIHYDISEYGRYTFRLSRQSDGSLISEIQFDYNNSQSLIEPQYNLSNNNSTYTYNNTLNVTQNTTNTSINESNILNVTTLTVLDKCSNVFLNLDKDNYTIGESVQIKFSNIFGNNVNTELSIITHTLSYKFIGDLNSAVFIPSEIGDHTIRLMCDNILVFNKTFYVSDAVLDINNMPVSNNSSISGSASGTTWNKINLRNSRGQLVSRNIKISRTEAVNSSYLLNNRLNHGLDNKSSTRLDNMLHNRLNVLNDTSNNPNLLDLDVDIDLNGIGGSTDSSLKLNSLIVNQNDNLENNLNIYIEDVPRASIEFDGNVLASFAMDLSNLDFVNGTFTKTAVGKELWKCALWNFTNQRCDGSWIKIMDITPGTAYDLEVSPIDPGYIETGVATVNTLKSLYYPNDDVDIVMVVLDTQGYLVSGANVILTIIAPDNTTTITSTDDFITSNHKGIYEVGFTGTSLEGNYTLIVQAIGDNVNSTMISQFTISSNHPFDIRRTIPVTIDPNQGPFDSEILLTINLDASSVSTFDYTEVLPINFIITDLGGGTESVVGSNKYITWYNLTNNSIIRYSAQTPLEVPNVYQIGQGFINYAETIGNSTNSTIIQTFYESRPWFLAIDPVFVGTFFMLWDNTSNAPPGWTCVSCNSGDPFYQKFILGNSTYGVTGGNATHNHTINYVSHTVGATYVGANGGGVAGANRATAAHTHAGIAATTTTSASNYPLFRQLKVIAYNNPGSPQIIPAGAIGIFNTSSLPANWTQYTAENGYFIFGNATANITGGANNHSHTASITTVNSAGTLASRSALPAAVANAPHTHSGSGTTALDVNLPSYIDIVLAKTNVTTTVPFGQGFIGMFNAEVGDGWINMSQPGQPFYQKILRAAATYNATGGGLNVSNHTNLVITTGAPSATANTRTGAGNNYATSAHTHDVTVSFTNASKLPPYVSVVFGYANNTPIYPPMINRTECFRQGTGWVNCTTLGFNSNITAVRVSCYSQNLGGTVQNATFMLTNTYQNITYFNDTTSSNITGYWQLNISSGIILADSGNMTLNVRCEESVSAIGSQNINWTNPWGNISVRLFNPGLPKNVTQDRFFNFTVNVTCIGGQCGDVNISLITQPNSTVPMNSGNPFYTISQNPMLLANTSCLTNIIAGTSCLTTWTVNATGTINTSRLFYANATSINFSSTVSRNTSSSVNITIIGNLAPITQSAQLTPPEPLFFENLNCTFNMTDQNVGDNLTATVNWYRNGVPITSQYIEVIDGELQSAILSSTYLTVGDLWKCGVVPYDQSVYGNETYSSEVLVLASIPPKIRSMDCLRNNAIWVPCTSMLYNQTIGKVRANCTATDSYPVSASFSLKNIEDNYTFFSGSTSDNSTGYWIFDNSDVLILDSGNFNLSVTCTDANGTIGYNSSVWLVPWGNLTVRLISPNISMNVTSKQFFNFTSSVTCTGGECGYMKATLDPYREYFSSFENSTEGWTHYAMNGTTSPPAGTPAVGLDQWHRSSQYAKFGNYSWKYGSVGSFNYSTPPAAVLITPTYDIRTNISNATVVSFYHYLNAENTWDGGKIEYMINTNGTWIKVPAALFLTGGYNGNYALNSAFVPNGWTNGEVIWTNTVGTLANFSLVRINISTLRGENITFRFYFGGDDNTAGLGWIIDGFNITAWSYDNDKGVVSMDRSALPFYTISQNPTNSTNVSCLADMRSGNTCNITWEVNASDTKGNYTFFVIYESINYTTQVIQKNTTQINLTIISNIAPTVSAISLGPEYALVGGVLYCNFTVRDASPLDRLGANVTWYRNNTPIFSNNYSVQFNVPYVVTLGEGNLSVGDTWHCGVRPYDRLTYGTQVNSSNKTVVYGIPPKLSALQCLRNDTTWINCSSLVFGDKFSGVRANCTNVNATITNATFNFSNTPDSKIFFDIVSTTNTTNWWTYYYNMTIIDSGEFVMKAACYNNNSVSESTTQIWTLPWGKLVGYLVDPNVNTVVEYDKFFTFTSNISCTGGECGNVTALLDPGFPLGSPTNGTADDGSVIDISGTDDEAGSYVDTQISDANYYVVGEGGWGDANSLIELDFNVSSLNIDANKNVTFLNVTMTYCHSGDVISTVRSGGCNGNAPVEKALDTPQDVLLYNRYTDTWDSIGVLNVTNNENLATSNYSFNGSTNINLSKYVNESGFIRLRIEMITGGASNSNQAFLAVNYVMLTLSYEYIKGGAPIPTTIGALPFYTNNSNPYTQFNYSCLANMSSLNGGCTVTWNVNATGSINTTHEFWVIYTSSSYPTYVNLNSTKHIFITIENSTAVPPIVTLNYPAPNYYTSNPNVTFNCSATDNRNVTSLALYGNFSSTFEENESIVTSGKNTTQIFNRTLSDGVYTWNCMATDSDSNINFAVNRTLRVDTTPPNINLSTPIHTDNISSRTVTFNFTVTDNIDSALICNLTIDAVVRSTDFTATNGLMTSRTVTNLSQGDHYWNVTCKDDGTNTNTSETRLFTVLSTPPVITLQTIDNYFTNQNSVDLYYFTDDGGYIEQADLYINGVLNQTKYYPEVVTGDTNMFSLYDLGQGVYTWTVNVTNNGGLSSQATPRTFYIEFTAPTLNVTFPPDNYLNNFSTINFNFTTTDLMDSVMTCKITINGVDVVTGIGANNATPKIQPVSGLRNGPNYWNITCQNDAGNSNTSITRLMNVSSPPTITLNNPANNTFQKVENITLYYTPVSSINLSNCSLILNGVRNQTNTTPTNNAQNNFKLYNLNDGQYNWSINCTDNTSTTGSSATRVFSIDRTAPYIILTKPDPDSTTYGTTTLFNFTAYDTIDPSLTCNLIIDGALNRSNIISPSGQWVNVSVAIAEGNHSWRIDCVDHALNTNSSETRNFTQVGAPTVTPVYPAPNAYLNYTNDINITYIPSSGNTILNATLYINGLYNQSIPNPSNGAENSFFVNLTNGLYNWTVIIFDDIGMNGSSPIRYFTVDTVSPIVNIMTPSNDQTVGSNNVTFRFNVTDNLGGTIKCNITVNDTLEWIDVNVTSGSTATRYKLLPDGDYNWSVMCSDNSGNKNYSALINFTVYAPPNVTLNFPTPNYRTKMQNITFNYTPRHDIGLDTCTLVINDVDVQNSSVIAKNVPNYFNMTDMVEGFYNWTVRCNDSSQGHIFAPTARNLTIDLTPPTINMTYPGVDESINSNTIQFNWTATDYPINIACRLYIDDAYNRTVTQMSGTYFTPTVNNFTSGLHNWSLNCSDDLNNSIWSETRSFTINNADLYLDNNRIYFNNTNPNENQTITISANVTNIGGVPATGVLVEFYDGDPGAGGIFIGNATGNVNVNGSTIFSVPWNITTGYHIIYVSTDPYDVISELSELNNNATRNISILSVIIDSPLNATWFVNPNITVLFTLTDYTTGYGTGLINYSVYVDNVLNGQTGVETDAVQGTVNVTVSQGMHSIKIEALDYLGRKKNSTAVFVIVDYTPPNSTILTQNNTWYNSSEPIINITSRDNYDTNINYSIYVNGSINTQGNITNGTTLLVNLSIPVEGYYELIMEAYDDLNNTANSTPKYIYVDWTAPTINLNTPVDGANYTVRTVVLNYTPTDNLAFNLSCNVTLDGSSVASQNVGNGNSSTYTANNLAEGTHYWNITCRDQALNYYTSNTQSFNVYIAPVITLLNPPNNNWSNLADNVFYFNVSDETGLENCSIIINGSVIDTKTISQLILNSTNNFTITGMSSGIYNWSIACYDNTTYHSYNYTSNRTLYVDLLLPEPYILTQNNTWFNVGNPPISINISDNMDTTIDYTLYVNGTANVSGTVSSGSPVAVNLVNLQNGTYEVMLSAVDNAGNRRNSTPIIIYVDTVRPSINLTNPLNDTNVTTSTIELNFTPTDNMADMLMCNLTLDNVIIASNISVSNGANQNVTVSGLLGGYHYWNVTCMDYASNRNTSSTFRFYVVMPDLYINASDIFFSNDYPIENETINITATIQNIGLADAQNFTVEVRLNSLTGTSIYAENISLAMNTSLNITANYSLPIGNTTFYILVDTPFATNGTIREAIESNNNASRSISVGLWEYIMGLTNDRLVMNDFTNQTIYDWLVSNASGSKIFAADIDSSINWRNLQALGINMSNLSSPIDFNTLDTQLGSNTFSDSVNRTYTSSGSPKELVNYTIFARRVNNVPIVNSTNNSNFKTGILWDYGDGGTRYLGSQDVVFVSPINKNTQGYNATVDYELRVPATLRSYKAGQNLVVFYAEIN